MRVCLHFITGRHGALGAFLKIRLLLAHRMNREVKSTSRICKVYSSNLVNVDQELGGILCSNNSSDKLGPVCLYVCMCVFVYVWIQIMKKFLAKTG